MKTETFSLTVKAGDDEEVDLIVVKQGYKLKVMSENELPENFDIEELKELIKDTFETQQNDAVLVA